MLKAIIHMSPQPENKEILTPLPPCQKKTIDSDQKYKKNENVTEPSLSLLADVVCKRSLTTKRFEHGTKNCEQRLFRKV